MTINAYGRDIPCTRAIKGADYIEAYNGDTLLEKFCGITDFSGYGITGGEWSTPVPTQQEDTDALLADHEERLIYMELGV